MEYEYLVAATGAIVATVLISSALWRHASAKLRDEMAIQIAATRELEKQLHIKDREFLEERNRIELLSAENLRFAKTASFEEGRLVGVAESHRDHINELAALRTELCTKLEIERQQAGEDARERLRAEYELQIKLFSVKISPYVKITEDKGLFGDKYETVAGYQYQLLVNGIPAFSPHVVPERIETKKAINEELEHMLIRTAQQAAETAIQLYLGGSPQFAKLAPILIERMNKK